MLPSSIRQCRFHPHAEASAADARADAEAVVEDAKAAGSGAPALTMRLASLGGGGTSTQNCYRDLLGYLHRHRTLPIAPYWTKIRVWDKVALKETEVDFPMLLPHELLSSAFH